MNIHGRSKTGSSHISEQFNCCCKGKFYTIQIIEVLSTNGHDENDIVDENIRRLRLHREYFWMKTLRTNFPDSLYEKSKDLKPEALIGSDVYITGRSGERINKCQKNRYN